MSDDKPAKLPRPSYTDTLRSVDGRLDDLADLARAHDRVLTQGLVSVKTELSARLRALEDSTVAALTGDDDTEEVEDETTTYIDVARSTDVDRVIGSIRAVGSMLFVFGCCHTALLVALAWRLLNL